MSWIKDQSDSKAISIDQLPVSLRYFVWQIENWPSIIKGSLTIYCSEQEERKFVLAFSVSWDRPSETKDSRILFPEKIALWFNSAGEVPDVRADREDFPSNLPHLFSVIPGEPSSICLAQSHLASEYSRSGMATILSRLSSWLTDAAAGTLERDGWEPIPIFSRSYAEFDTADFQSLPRAESPTEPGYASGDGFAINDIIEGKPIHIKLLSRKQNLDRFTEAFRNSGRLGTRHLRWHMFWGPKNKPISRRFPEKVLDWETLIRFADASHCGSEIRSRSDAIDQRKEPFVILIGTWRPRRLSSSIPNLAPDDFGCLEVSAFLIIVRRNQVRNTVKKYILSLNLLSQPTTDMLSRLTGYEKKPGNSVLIGAGALGSKISDHLIREGAPSLKIIDKEIFDPHNVARHTLTTHSVFSAKSDEVANRLRAINPFADIQSIPSDIVTQTSEEVEKTFDFKKPGVVIDASAEPEVLRFLCSVRNPMRVVKVELALEGRLGFIMIEGRSRSPRIDELKVTIPSFYKEVPLLGEWLNSDDRFELGLGIGCASITLRVPDGIVSLHASHLMGKLREFVRLESSEGGIGILSLEPGGIFDNWVWSKESTFFGIQQLDNDWIIKIRDSIVKEIRKAAEGSDVEAGGYLYGSYDFDLKRVYIVEYSHPKPLAADISSIELPPPGFTSKEQALLKMTAGQLRFLGSWHTHVGDNASPSSVDIRQENEFKRSNSLPHVMLICGKSGSLTGKLTLPPEWADQVKA